MRKILLISGILMIAWACSPEKVNFSQLQDRNGVFYLANKDKPFSGDVISYINGRVELEGRVEKGLREGSWIYYYSSGQKKMEGNFKEGVKDGTWTYWKDNGIQEATEMYKFGKLLSNEGTVTGEAKGDTTKPAGSAGGAVQESTPQTPEQKKAEKKQVAVNWDDLHGGPVKYYKGIPYTGPVVRYQPNGQKDFDGNMLRGKKSGKWILYDFRGNVRDIRYY